MLDPYALVGGQQDTTMTSRNHSLQSLLLATQGHEVPYTYLHKLKPRLTPSQTLRMSRCVNNKHHEKGAHDYGAIRRAEWLQGVHQLPAHIPLRALIRQTQVRLKSLITRSQAQPHVQGH